MDRLESYYRKRGWGTESETNKPYSFFNFRESKAVWRKNAEKNWPGLFFSLRQFDDNRLISMCSEMIYESSSAASRFSWPHARQHWATFCPAPRPPHPNQNVARVICRTAPHVCRLNTVFFNYLPASCSFPDLVLEVFDSQDLQREQPRAPVSSSQPGFHPSFFFLRYVFIVQHNGSQLMSLCSEDYY